MLVYCHDKEVPIIQTSTVFINCFNFLATQVCSFYPQETVYLSLNKMDTSRNEYIMQCKVCQIVVHNLTNQLNSRQPVKIELYDQQLTIGCLVAILGQNHYLILVNLLNLQRQYRLLGRTIFLLSGWQHCEASNCHGLICYPVKTLATNNQSKNFCFDYLRIFIRNVRIQKQKFLYL